MADTADILLGFSFDPDTFAESIKNGLSGSVLRSNIARIDQCKDNLLGGGPSFDDVDLEEFRSYLRSCFMAKVPVSDVSAEKRQLRALSYALEAEVVYEFIRFELQVMETNWSATYLRGLLHSLLHHWMDLNMDSRVAISNFLIDALRKAESKSARRMRDMAAYINEQGPFRLGEFLRGSSLPLKDALSIFDLPSDRISYTYFSDCIAAYYTNADSSVYHEIRTILKEHNNVRTTKKLIPLMVLSEAERRRLGKELTDFAVSMIGDPSIESNWAPFKGATEQEATNLEMAREAVLAALSAAVINIFFNTLCDDTKRRDFWLKHTNKIKDFRVYGSSYSRQLMASAVDAQVLRRHFITIPSNSNTCALVMFIGNYAIIEFTDVGALYVYMKGSRLYNLTVGQTAKVENVGDLKVSSLVNLVDDEGYLSTLRDEGRMVHIGHWDSRMTRWLNNKIGK